MPEPATFALLREWRPVFDQYVLLYSPAYHAFRAWFGWPPTEKGRVLDTCAERLDRREGRIDPVADRL